MYGIGKFAVAPAPPVPQLVPSYAVSMPSEPTPALICAAADGRLPVSRCSSLRSSISLTGTPAALANFAQIKASAPALDLEPKPPPMNCVTTCTFGCGIESAGASCWATPTTPCVEIQTLSLSPSHSQTEPCVSMQTCVITCVSYVCSTT